MVRVSRPTHASMAAEPVSPDVATTMVARWPRADSSWSNRRPTSWSATSLKASVGPQKSSRRWRSSRWTTGQTSGRLVFADLELDEDTREVSRGGRPIELTATEYRLLHYLMLNPRRVLTRAQLLDHVWSYDFRGDARVLETYMSYLRKKIDAQAVPLLHTVRGVGYALRLPRE